MLRDWVITLHRFEHHEVTGAIMRRHEEVGRLDGNMTRLEVARELELRYARLYQPGWDEATGKVEEPAHLVPDEIWVGHEPSFSAKRSQ